MQIKKIAAYCTNTLFKTVCGKNKAKADYLMKLCCSSYEKVTGDYCSYRLRLGVPDVMTVNENLLNDYSNIAIIMQGPLILENHFTLNTLKFYRKIYPKCKIIVSTWDNENSEEVTRIEEIGVIVLRNTRPINTGLGNMNFQILSTRNGIKKAEELGVQYILKTRTDQRINKCNVLDFFESLTETFPVLENKKQKKRIIAFQGTVGGTMFVPYFIADFLYYGHIDDLKQLFAIPLDDMNLSKDDRLKWLQEIKRKNPTIQEYYNLTAPEIMIMKNYVKTYISSNYKDTVEDYWKFVRDYLVTVSWDDIGLFWPKYNRYDESTFFRIVSRKDNRYNYYQYTWTFNNWLMLYTDKLQYKLKFEMYSQNTCDKLNMNI